MTVSSSIVLQSRSKFFTLVIVLVAGLTMLPAHAQSNLQFPSTNSIDYNGTALSITNMHAHSAGSVQPAAIAGIESGSSGIGLLGHTSGPNSSAVYGVNVHAGYAGHFVLQGVAPSGTSSAVLGVDSGGSTTTVGAFGNAGNFQITNAKNTDPAVSISTNGIDSYALKVINNSVTDFAVTYPPSGNSGGIAGYFEVNSPNPQFSQPGMYAGHFTFEKPKEKQAAKGNHR